MKLTDLPVFQTDRLVARHWDLEMAEQALKIYSDPAVTEHIYVMHCETVEAMQEKLQWVIERNKTYQEPLGSYPVFLKSTGEMIGTALIKNLPDADGNFTDDIEIGWHLGSKFWGQGYATEFGNELVRMGLGDLEIPTLFAVTGPENLPSQAVCKRLGMKHLGQTEKYYGQTVELFEISGPLA